MDRDEPWLLVLPAEAFDRLLEDLENPPEPTQALIDLMKRPRLWAKEEREENGI